MLAKNRVTLFSWDINASNDATSLSYGVSTSHQIPVSAQEKKVSLGSWG